TNLVEFAYGTDPRVPGDFQGLVTPRFAGTNGILGVEVWQHQGHQSGAQINLAISADLVHWTWPWWQRTVTNSQPGDPIGSVRELFITVLRPTNAWFVRSQVQLIEAGPQTARYYVATNGSDSN